MGRADGAKDVERSLRYGLLLGLAPGGGAGGVGLLTGVGLGLGVFPLGTIDGVGDGEALGDGEGEGVGGGATHSVPGKYSSFSEAPGDGLEVGDGDGDVDGEGDTPTLVLFWHAAPSTNPLGRWKLSTLKLAWLRPLLMKSRRTELPTMVP